MVSGDRRVVVPRAEGAGVHRRLVGTRVAPERGGERRQHAHHHDPPDGEQRRRLEHGAQQPGRDHDCARQHGHYLLRASSAGAVPAWRDRERPDFTRSAASAGVRGAHARPCSAALSDASAQRPARRVKAPYEHCRRPYTGNNRVALHLWSARATRYSGPHVEASSPARAAAARRPARTGGPQTWRNAPSASRNSAGLVGKQPKQEGGSLRSRRIGTLPAWKRMTTCRWGDVVLVRFPYSDLSRFRKRPALVVQDEQVETGLSQRLVCQITSNLTRCGVTRVLVR